MSSSASSAPPFTAALALAIRSRRDELGLSQKELAHLAGCGVVFVYAVEQGKPTLRLDKLVDVLGVLGLGLAIVTGPPGIHAPDARGGT